MRFWKRALLVLLVLCAVGLPAGYFGGRAMLGRRFHGWRVEGVKASEAGDHARAADFLGRYLRRRPHDTEALGLFVKSRERAELPGGQHLAETVAALQALLGQEPDRVDERRHLLEIYARLDRRPEAADTANVLLAKAPGDARALEIKTDVLTRQRQFRDALVAAEAWTKAAPADAKAHSARLSLRAQLGQPREAIVGDARAMREAHPGDVRFELLEGFAHALSGGDADQAEARRLLKQVAGREGLDAELTATLVTLLDDLGMTQESLAVLRQAAAGAGATAEARHALARRCWEAGNWEETAAALRDLDPGRPESDATLVAMKSVALANLGKAAEAEACRRALAARDQAAARAWTLILGRETPASAPAARGSETGAATDRQIVTECAAALTLDPRNAYLDYFLGEACARIGEADLAAQAWRRSFARNPAWVLPPARLVDVLLQKGQVADALQAAVRASRRDANPAISVVALARAWAASLESGGPGSAEDLLGIVSEVQQKLPGEEHTLLIRINLLAKAGRTDEAAAALRSAVAATPPPPQRLFLSLAGISRRLGLGVEEECYTRCEQAHGATPGLAYARAVGVLAAGDAGAGLRTFDEVARRGGKGTGDAGGDGPAWRLARAQYLDLSDSPEAKGAWVALGDARPEDLSVQQAAAASRAARGDWEFMQRTVDRLKTLTGETALGWRLAQARLLVEAPRNEADYVQGSVLLNNLVREQPRLVEARVLLAKALVRMKRVDGAIEHLTAAVGLDPGAVPIAMQLATLLQSRGDLERARQQIERVAPLARTAAERRQAALLLAQQGNTGRAIQLLEEPQAPVQGGANAGAGRASAVMDELMLSALYRQERQFDKAEAVVAKLLERPEPPLAAIEFAVSMYVAQGRRPEAERALARLDAMKDAPAGLKELAWGTYFSQAGEPAKAVEQYRAATRVAPGNPAGWRVLAAALMAEGNVADALATAEQAMRALPEDKGFASIKANADLLRESAGDAGLRPLVLSVMRDPAGSAAERELLLAVAEGRRSNDAERAVAALRTFAANRPDFLAARLQLARQYRSMGRPDEALDVTRRTMKDFPSDPAPARLAIQLCAESGRRWSEMQTAAQALKQRSPGEAPLADVAIARAHLGEGRAADAVAQLRAYVESAKAAPDRYVDVIVTYCVALAGTGRSADGAELMWPLASKTAPWRVRWIQVAAELPDAATGAQWLDRAAGIVPEGAAEERALLAEAYDSLGRRASGSVGGAGAESTRKASEIYKQVVAIPGVSPAAVMMAASQAERSGDGAAAEALYRRALEADPKLFAAHNNLAMLVASRAGDMKQALASAAEAVRLQPRAAPVRDTMAFVQAKAGDAKAAVESIRTAVALEPDNAKWRVRLAQYLLDAGDVTEAGKAIAVIDERRLDVRRLPVSVQQQLGTLRKQVRERSANAN